MHQFSIIVVCLNPGDKLNKTVSSVLSQTYTDYEILVKDGGSRDGSVEELAQWCKGTQDGVLTQEKVRIVVKKDTGIYDAMNQAVEEARGEYILFLNCGDTFFDREVLEKTASYMKENPDAGIYYGDTFCEKSGSLDGAPGEITPFVCFRNIPCHQACFYHYSLFEKRAYDLQYKIRADYEHFLWCALSKRENILGMKFPVASYEGGGYSESKANIKRDKEEHRDITKKYMTGGQLFWYRAYLVVTLAPLRKKLAESKRFPAFYQKIKGGLRR